jgi:hypothetical protein
MAFWICLSVSENRFSHENLRVLLSRCVTFCAILVIGVTEDPVPVTKGIAHRFPSSVHFTHPLAADFHKL